MPCSRHRDRWFIIDLKISGDFRIFRHCFDILLDSHLDLSSRILAGPSLDYAELMLQAFPDRYR